VVFELPTIRFPTEVVDPARGKVCASVKDCPVGGTKVNVPVVVTLNAPVLWVAVSKDPAVMVMFPPGPDPLAR
jgi:hypothetical protein